MRSSVAGLAIVLAVSASCTSVPRQVIDITRTLQDYSAQLGQTHANTVRLYHERIDNLNRNWERYALAVTVDAEEELTRTRAQLAELELTYAQVAAALDEVLRADPSVPRAAMFGRGEALELAVLMMNQARRSNLRGKPVEATWVRSASRSLATQEATARVAQSNDRLRTTLEDRIATEYENLDHSFEDLIAYFRAGLRTRSERKQILRASQRSAFELENDAKASRPLLRGPELFEQFDRELEALNAPDRQ